VKKQERLKQIELEKEKQKKLSELLTKRQHQELTAGQYYREKKKIEQHYKQLLNKIKAKDKRPTQCFRVLSSPDDPIVVDATRMLLNAIHRSDPPELSFMLFGDGSVPEIYAVFKCAASFTNTLEQYFLTYFASAVIEPEKLKRPKGHKVHSFYKIEHDLNHLKDFRGFHPDPLALFVTTMEQLEEKDTAYFTVNFIPDEHYGFARDSDPDVKKKLEQPLWQVEISLTVHSPNKTRAATIRSALEKHLGQYRSENAHLFRWTKEMEEVQHQKTLTGRRLSEYRRDDPEDELDYFMKCFRTPGLAYISSTERRQWRQSILNTNELLGLVHLPHKSITSEILMRTTTKSKAVPDLLTHAGITLGTNEHRHKTKQVKLPHNLRNRHIYIVGATRQGKSTLMTNLVKQDLEHGAGFAVVDPHGDLIEDILALIPKKRISDTILFNAQDRDHPVTLNVMAAKSEQETEQVAADFMITFQRLFSDSWGTRMEYILRNAIDTLLNAGNKTFPDIRRILVNSSFRENVLDQITNPYLLEFWEEEFSSLPRSAIDPILNKLHQFQRTAIVRNILGQPKSKLNFYTAMQTKKILLVNLGNINADDKHLLGSLIVSQLQLAAMRRGSLPPKQRIDFTIYIDEFQNFITSAFDTILSEAAKFKINLVIAHQFVSQIPNKIRASIFGNAGTMIYFNLGIDDANYLRPVLGDFDPEDVAKLPQGNTITFVRQAGDLFPMRTYPPADKPKQTFIEQIINHSRTEYGTPREELEQRLRKPREQKQQDPNIEDFGE